MVKGHTIRHQFATALIVLRYMRHWRADQTLSFKLTLCIQTVACAQFVQSHLWVAADVKIMWSFATCQTVK